LPPDHSFGGYGPFRYLITAKAFEIRLFRRLTIYRLKREDIVGAHVVTGFANRLFGAWALGSHPWNTLNLGGSFSRRFVLLEKRRWFRFLAITPSDPFGFIELLGLPDGERLTRN
jgi:hypothetical protein